METLASDLLFSGVFPFVGKDQYRFVGGVNCAFRDAYAALYPAKTTILSVRSVAHAEISFTESSQYQKLRLCERAARHGELIVLQWLHFIGCPWGSWTCADAALYGHLEVLQWARAKGCSWDAWTCANAARNGHLAVLQWARANGCAWDTMTCSDAAMNGHLDVLKWARSNGCPWDMTIFSWAARNGHLEVIQWLADNWEEPSPVLALRRR